MDAAQWSQQVPSLARPMDQEITSTTPPNNVPTNSRGGGSATPQQQQSLERRTRPQKDQNVNCPRCNSTNTKFCYYNNYSLTQPRYFCKTCRRYWTQGGSLRNVPVGGGSRKNKRSSSSASFSTSSTPTPTSTTTPQPMHNKILIPDLNPPTSLSHLLTASQNPNIKYLEGQDLNLAFPIQGLFHHHMDHHHPHQLPKMEGNNTNNNENHEPPININGNISNNNSCTTTNTTTTTTTTSPPPLSALELLRTGIASRGSLNPFVPMPMTDSNTLYQSGYPSLQDFKPSVNFFSSPNHDQDHNNMVGSGDHHHHNNNNNTPSSGNNARLLFPFADMNKLAANTNSQHHDHSDDQRKDAGGNDHHNHHHHQQQQQQAPAGYWSGMLGGGTW